MKAVVFTLGCKVNECESDALIEGLNRLGYEVSDKLSPADLYIINTCAVTKEAEKKSRQAASRALKLNPEARIIYTGCACQKSPESFIRKKNVSLVTGSFSKNSILSELGETGVKIAEEPKKFEELCTVKSLGKRTFVKVQDGCDNFCSYCIIPFLRGRSRSRNPEKIIEEIRLSSSAETVINGINLSAYDYGGIRLSGLMNALKEENTRIRLGSLEVGVIDEEFLTSLSNLKNFAPHFHLSLQSGSDAVLKSMNRHYTREEFIKKTRLIREFFPNAGITTDIIVGYPTETEKDFSQTLSLAETVRFSDIHPFIFSPREGTNAYKLKDLSPETKKRRMDEMLKLKAKLKSEFINSQTGKTLEMIPEERVEGYTEGYSENYLRLYLKEKTDKNTVKVRVLSPFKEGALAEIIR